MNNKNIGINYMMFQQEIYDPISEKTKVLTAEGGLKGTSNWRIKQIWKHYIEDLGEDPENILPNVEEGDPITITYENGRFREITPEPEDFFGTQIFDVDETGYEETEINYLDELDYVEVAGSDGISVEIIHYWNIQEPYYNMKNASDVELLAKGVYDRMNRLPKGHVVLQMVYMEELIGTTSQFKTASFNSFDPRELIKDDYDWYEIEAIIRNKFKYATQYNKDAKTTRVKFHIIPYNAGGCYKGSQDQITNFEDFKNINPLSSNNNCFFACCKAELGIKPTKGVCNELRKKYKIKKNEPITTIKATEIIENEVGVTLSIYNGNENLIEGDNGADIELLLTKGHYTRLIMKKARTKCSICGLLYVEKHSTKNCMEMLMYKNPSTRKLKYVKMDKKPKTNINKK